jgi:NAD+ synthase
MDVVPLDLRERLLIEPAVESERIVGWLRTQLAGVLKRRGLVVGVSGGVDSAVCAALAARAVGPDRVLALLMPERDSDTSSTALAAAWCRDLGIRHEVEEITSILESVGCYRRRDDAIRRVVPEFREDWGCKVVVGRQDGLDGLTLSYLTVRPPGGEARTVRLPAAEYREIVAATSFKQRVRKMLEYHHADRLHAAVVGTPNRLEYDLGFFVKGGDGLADLKPIAHLYKTQIYQLAEYLSVPASITGRPPSTDTYSLPQSQEEFFFSLPLAELDQVLFGYREGLAPAMLAPGLGLTEERVTLAYREIDRKRAVAQPLHMSALRLDPDMATGGAGRA